jgi:hypothetical protein
MPLDPLWLDLARFDPAAGEWRWDRLRVSLAVPAEGYAVDVGAGVVLEVHDPTLAETPVRVQGCVLSTAGDRALIECDLEASRPLVDALPEFGPYGVFIAVPMAAFRR